MRPALYMILMSSLLGLCVNASAAIYKCTDDQGQIAYSTQKCDHEGDEIAITTHQPSEDAVKAKEANNKLVNKRINKHYKSRNAKRKIKALEKKISALERRSEKKLIPLKDKYESQRYLQKHKHSATRTKKKIDTEEEKVAAKVDAIAAEIKQLKQQINDNKATESDEKEESDQSKQSVD